MQSTDQQKPHEPMREEDKSTMKRADIRRVLKILGKHPKRINQVHQQLLDEAGIDYTCEGSNYGFSSDEDVEASGKLRDKANAIVYAEHQKHNGLRKKQTPKKKKRKK